MVNGNVQILNHNHQTHHPVVLKTILTYVILVIGLNLRVVLKKPFGSCGSIKNIPNELKQYCCDKSAKVVNNDGKWECSDSQPQPPDPPSDSIWITPTKQYPSCNGLDTDIIDKVFVLGSNGVDITLNTNTTNIANTCLVKDTQSTCPFYLLNVKDITFDIYVPEGIVCLINGFLYGLHLMNIGILLTVIQV